MKWPFGPSGRGLKENRRNRQLYEIHCNDCPGGGWFIVNVNLNWEGSYVFVCPKCGHEHPRCVRQREMKAVNEDVHFIGKKSPIEISREAGDGKPVRIVVPESSWSKERRLELTKFVPAGFMGEAWMRKAAEEKGVDLLAEMEE